MYQSSIFFKSFKIFLTKTLIVVSIFASALYAGVKVYAVYYPTDNITNPACAPGAVGCYVSLLPDQTSNSGSLLFTNGSNPVWSNPSALNWDATNGRLGVGTNVPAALFSVGSASQFQVDSTGNATIPSMTTNTAGFIMTRKQATPPAPTVSTIAVSGGNCTPGTHVFAVVFNTASGHTDTSPVSSTVTCDSTHSKVTVNVPEDKMYVLNRDVYASKAGTTSPLYLVSSSPVIPYAIQNPDQTEYLYGPQSEMNAYVFNISDASLTTTIAPTTNTAIDPVHQVTTSGQQRYGSIPELVSSSVAYQFSSSGSTNLGIFQRPDPGEARLTVISGGIASPTKFNYPTLGLINSGFTTGANTYGAPLSNAVIATVNIRGSLNSAGAFSCSGCNGFDWVSTENWSTSSAGTKLNIRLTRTGTYTTDTFIPIGIDSASGSVFTGATADSSTYVMKVQNSANTSLFSIKNDGKIGINTTAPASRFHVGVAPTASANYGTISLGGGAFDGTTSGYFGTASSSNALGTSIAVNEISGYAGDLMNLQVAGVSKFKVNSIGNVTIGSTTGNAMLSVVGDNTAGLVQTYRYQASQSAPRFELFKARGTQASPSALIVTDIAGSFDVNGYNGIGFDRLTTIRTWVDSIVGNVITPSMSFEIGTNSGTSESKMTLWNTGNLLIASNAHGLTDNGNRLQVVGTGYFSGNVGIGTSSPSFPLDVNTTVSSSQTYGYVNASGLTGTSTGSNPYSIRATGRVLASEFNAVSDARLKDVQFDIDPSIALNMITHLRPISFTWKNNPTGQPVLGLLAQEVEQVIPNAVSQISTDAFPDQRELSYNQLTAVSIGAIKELNIRLLDISSLDLNKSSSVANLVKTFLANVDNQIGDVYMRIVHSDKVQTKELCSSSGNCLSEEQFNLMIQEFKNTHSSPQNIAPIQNDNPPVVENPDNNSGNSTPDNSGTPAEIPTE